MGCGRSRQDSGKLLKTGQFKAEKRAFDLSTLMCSAWDRDSDQGSVQRSAFSDQKSKSTEIRDQKCNG